MRRTIARRCERLLSVYRPLSAVLVIGALAALVIGWVRPAPWLLALLLVVLLSVLWGLAVLRFLSADAWADALAGSDGAPPQRAPVGSSNPAENR
jgi:predicted RND superfamily exporter protein